MDPQAKTKYYIIGIIVVILFLSIVGWFAWKSGSSGSGSNYDYVIPGVTPVNVFNHQGNLSNLNLSDTVSSIASVLEYWNPGANNFVEISYFIKSEKVKNGDSIRRLLDGFYKDKYVFKREQLSIDELKQYINPKVKTPLLLFFPLSKDQPAEITFHPLTVLIGIKESEQMLVLHDFFLGNNYEISFTDFEKSWESMRSDERNAYYIIQPVELKKKLVEINSRKTEPYPIRTEVMDDFGGLIANYAISRAMEANGNVVSAMDYALKVKDDPRFQDELHPFYKMGTYLILTSINLRRGDIDLAKQFALSAVEFDHDLDKPYKNWPGIEMNGNAVGVIGEDSAAYRLLGDAYFQNNEPELAKQSYKKALSIKPLDKDASAHLDLVNSKLLVK
jgi:tetratricopeptide (TPR) repeat protein